MASPIETRGMLVIQEVSFGKAEEWERADYDVSRVVEKITQDDRRISIARLSTLLRVDLRPIDLVVFQESDGDL